MRTIGKALVLAFAVALSAAAAEAANDSDQAYCNRLSGMYQRYLGHSLDGPDRYLRSGSLDAQVSATQCQQNPRTAIPVLEQRLRAAGFSLPGRG